MKTVLAVAAHPDDIEFLMAGTLMRLAEAGFCVHYWNLADGCCGSDKMDREETARVRREEAITSCEKLGGVFHEPICADLSIFYDRETLAKVTSEIRSIEPAIILTHALSDYMEDHMNTARLVVTGAFSRAMKNFPVDPPRPLTTQNICLYHAQPYSNLTPMRKIVVPDLFVDTSELLERKKELLSCHKSQKDWLDHSQGINSYLSALESLDRSVGTLSGKYEMAEGWRKHLHMGFCNEEDDFLLQELSGENDIIFFEE